MPLRIVIGIELYRMMRSAVERFFGWLKSFRKIIT
jgi:transposase